jgi:phenylacetate-CoA ligase
MNTFWDVITLDAIYRSSPPWLQTLFLNAYAARIERLRRGKAYQRAVSQLLESQYWAPLRIEEYQDARIRAIVHTAYNKSPYYHRVLSAAGLTASDIRGRTDLTRLPLLTRDVLRKQSAELLTASRPSRQWSQGHTSGTTGSPLSVWYDRTTSILTDAVDWRQKVWGGMTDRDWIGILLGRVVVPAASQNPPFWRVNWIHRQIWFSSFHMNEENLESYINEIRRRRLRFLEGYPSTLFTVAHYLVRRGLSLPMQAVFTSSETLNDLQSETIEAAFGSKPFDFYGHAERTIFATECERHDGKHLAEEYGFTEVVDDEGQRLPDGEVGYLVGTSLHNTAMPLIRYQTGDISAILPDRCACGRTLIRIQSLTTKAEDIIVTPDGRIISPKILANAFKPLPQILNSQIIQDEIDHLKITIRPSIEFTKLHEGQLRSGLSARLGPMMRIEFEFVDDIPRERSGKFRWVISRVARPTHFSATQ